MKSGDTLSCGLFVLNISSPFEIKVTEILLANASRGEKNKEDKGKETPMW